MSATYWMLFHHCSTCTETMGPFWFLFIPPSLFFIVMCVNSTTVSTPFLLVFFNLCLFHYNLGLLFQWIFEKHSSSLMVFFDKGRFYYLKVLSVTPGLCITRMHTAAQEVPTKAKQVRCTDRQKTELDRRSNPKAMLPPMLDNKHLLSLECKSLSFQKSKLSPPVYTN